jgi:type IV pilus assembly protein PilV
MTSKYNRQAGASLIEVLVAVLILSFGMLALGGMLAYAVQLPKLSAYRATAVSLAAGHVERMRANSAGFAAGNYSETMTYTEALATCTGTCPCVYPACTAATMATLDKNESGTAIRRELPLGGMRVTCSGACALMEGDIWVLWAEPNTIGAFNSSASDECPRPTDAPTFPALTNPVPRCVHIRFRL